MVIGCWLNPSSLSPSTRFPTLVRAGLSKELFVFHKYPQKNPPLHLPTTPYSAK
ncbi:hypothetical protein H6G17_01345 [Chroococcidiopsis sp. FACHB-1243]|uniref:hypothetical protein n=1 Tax=Chroococcidiopsis sp. [FACHB-1243] TaxID=2692781 RepID=UPI0017873CD7|nr:hypothetical protein [Chroococcidiopsis sp. [FACHB-1243]]MBD2304167.1 hypothetical protein [Chroococcidiopsis sp. [FACHB-1243]]